MSGVRSSGSAAGRRGWRPELGDVARLVGALGVISASARPGSSRPACGVGERVDMVGPCPIDQRRHARARRPRSRLTPGPSAAMPASSAARAGGRPAVEELAQRGEVVRRLARQPPGAVARPRTASAHARRVGVAQEVGDLARRAACWRAPGRRARPAAPGSGRGRGRDAAPRGAARSPRPSRCRRRRSGRRRALATAASDVVGEHGDREARDGSPASERPCPRHSSVSRRPDARMREHLRDLRLVAAEAVLEHDRRAAGRRRRQAQRAAPSRTRHAMARHIGHARQPRRGCRAGRPPRPAPPRPIRPCVTSGPSKPAARSRPRNGGSRRRPCPTVAKLPSASRSLAWAMAMRSAEQVDRLVDDAARRSSPVRRLEQVGRIEHDAQARRAHLVDQAPAPGRRRSTTLASSGSMPRSTPWRSAIGDAPSPSRRADRARPPASALSGWCAPLVVRVARAGAQRDQPRAHGARRGGERRPAGAGPSAPHRRVGMDHVVGAGRARRSRRRSHARRRRRLSAAPARHGVRHGGEAEAGHVELHGARSPRPATAASTSAASVPGNVLAKMPSCIRRPPDTSARRTGLPVSRRLRDRHHGPHRGERRPRMPRPASGAPSSIASAKPSTWRR